MCRLDANLFPSRMDEGASGGGDKGEGAGGEPGPGL